MVLRYRGEDGTTLSQIAVAAEAGMELMADRTATFSRTPVQRKDAETVGQWGQVAPTAWRLWGRRLHNLSENFR